MKNSAKIITAALLCMITKTTMAQGIVVQGGFNLSNMVDLYNGESADLKIKPGFHVGIWYDVPINDKGLVFAPGIFYTTKGARDEYNVNLFFSGNMSVKESIQMNYIEIPLVLKRYFKLGNVLGYAGGGLFISYLTHATYKWDQDLNGENYSGKEKLELDMLNRFETGAILVAGVEINQILLGLQYSLGLANFGGEAELGDQLHSSVFSITAAYRISLKK